MNQRKSADAAQNPFLKIRAELIPAVELLLQEQLPLPALLILYSGIDIMASLGRPASQPRVTRTDFYRWVDDYLLPGSRLQCTSVDLYAARCGLLHSYYAESDLSRQRQARQIWYAWGIGSPQSLQRSIDQAGVDFAVAVHVDELLSAFELALDRFETALSADPARLKLVSQRTRKFLGFLIPPQANQT